MILCFKCACSILEIPMNMASMEVATCQAKDADRYLFYLEDCPGPDCNSSKNISNTLCEGVSNLPETLPVPSLHFSF